MERASLRARPTRRSVLIGAAATLFSGSPALAQPWSESRTIDTTKALLLINTLDATIGSLGSSTNQMRDLIMRAQHATNIGQMMRGRVIAYAQDRIVRNQNEFQMLVNLRNLKIWRAPQIVTEAIKVVDRIEQDAIVSNNKRAIAGVDRFLQLVGATRLS